MARNNPAASPAASVLVYGMHLWLGQDPHLPLEGPVTVCFLETSPCTVLTGHFSSSCHFLQYPLLCLLSEAQL